MTMFGGSGVTNDLETTKLEFFTENEILKGSPINKCGNIIYLSEENIERDMANIPKWKFSCYGPVYDQYNVISDVEYSPEELRYDFYYEMRNLNQTYLQSNKKAQELQQRAIRQLGVIRQEPKKIIFRYRQTTGYKGPILPMNAPPQCISTDKTFGLALQQAIQRRLENINNFDGGFHSSIFKSSTDVTGSQESAAFWGNTFTSSIINTNFGTFNNLEHRAFGGGNSNFRSENADHSGVWSTFGSVGDHEFSSSWHDSPPSLPTDSIEFKFSQTKSPTIQLPSCNFFHREGGAEGFSVVSKLSKGYTFETGRSKEQEEPLARNIQLSINQFEAFCLDYFKIGNIPLQAPPSIFIKRIQ